MENPLVISKDGPAKVTCVYGDKVEYHVISGSFQGLDSQTPIIVFSREDQAKIFCWLKSMPVQPEFNTARFADVKQLMAVECLRYGLVPVQDIEKLTMHYDDIRRFLVPRLEAADKCEPQVVEVCGEYGTGKSHICSVISHIARQQGFLVVNVSVDGTHVSLTNPEKLLNHLWRSLRGKDFDSCTPLTELYRRVIENGNENKVYRSRGYQRIKQTMDVISTLERKRLLDKYIEEMESLIASDDDISASQIVSLLCHESSLKYNINEIKGLKRMINNKLFARPDDMVESLAGHALIAKYAGFKGLVAIIDEFEVDRSKMTQDREERIADAIRAISEYIAGNSDHEPAPIVIFIATTGQEGLESDPWLDDMIEATGGKKYMLRPMTPENRRLLASRIFEKYASTYGVNESFNPDVVTKIEDDIIALRVNSNINRQFIKRYVCQLDMRYGPRAGSRIILGD